MSWIEVAAIYIQAIAIFITWVSYQLWSLGKDIQKMQEEIDVTNEFNCNNPNFDDLHLLLNTKGIVLDSDLDES